MRDKSGFSKRGWPSSFLWVILVYGSEYESEAAVLPITNTIDMMRQFVIEIRVLLKLFENYELLVSSKSCSVHTFQTR